MKAAPKTIRLALNSASCPSHSLPFQKTYGNFQGIFITNYFTVTLRPLLKMMFNVLHTLEPGGTPLKTNPFGGYCSPATVCCSLSIFTVK